MNPDEPVPFTITPLGESVFFAYVEAYAKKHSITRDEAIIRLSNGANEETDD